MSLQRVAFVNMRYSTIFAFVVTAAVSAQSALGQFVPAFPNAVFISQDPGPLGGMADFTAEGTFQADADGVFDVFVLFGPETMVAPPDFTYSSLLRWENPASAPVMREWVGNFNFSPPVALPITNSAAPESTPVELSFASDGLSAQVTDRTFPAFPFPVERYHAQISGLQPGETVYFQKIGLGATVVPEPSGLAIAGLLGLVGVGFRRR